MKYRSLIAMGIVAGVAGCGGSGTGNLGGNTLPGPPEFDALITEFADLTEEFDALDTSADLPTGSDVGYDGVFVAVNTFSGETSGVTSDMSLTMDFDAGEMSGIADDFYAASVDSEGNFNSSGTSTPGTIIFESSNINDIESVDVLMVGTLFFDGGNREAIGLATGEFRGDDGDLFQFEGSLAVQGLAFDLDATGIAD